MPNNRVNQDRIKWSSLIIGIIFLAIAVIVFSFPVKNFAAITWAIGVMSIITGFLEIVYRRVNKALLGISHNVTIAMGVMNIIFGLIVIFNAQLTSILFVYCFAFWFIFNGVMSIVIASPREHTNRGLRIFSIVLNIFGVLFGVLLLFNPLIGVLLISVTIALTFVMFGIFNVIDALI